MFSTLRENNYAVIARYKWNAIPVAYLSQQSKKKRNEGKQNNVEKYEAESAIGLLSTETNLLSTPATRQKVNYGGV